MKKPLFVIAFAFFVIQPFCNAPLWSVPPAPVKGVQGAKDDATCQQDWIKNSKGKNTVKFVVGGVVGIRSFTKDDYIKACKEGVLPAANPMQ